MIDELIRQLQDSDPAVRRRAIIALGRSKDAAALRALAGVVQNDPEPELRDLARKAGQYIRRAMKQQTAPSASQTSPAASVQEDAPPAPAPPAPSSRYKMLTDEIPPAKAEPEAPAPPASASRYKMLTDEIPAVGVEPEASAPRDDHALFMRPSAPSEVYDPYAPDDDEEVPDPPLDDDVARYMPPSASGKVYDPYAPDDDEEVPDPPLGEAQSAFMRPGSADVHEQLHRLEDELPDPTFGDAPSLDGLISLPEAKPEEAPRKPSVTIVRGRKYEIPRADRVRAKEYLDGALTLSMNGNNAKAMKDLTEALSLDPNLINDGFFNNVAATVTGLDGDAAAQMIIDREQRKRFTEMASRSQETKRIEEHMLVAEKPTSADVYFEVGLYTLIVIIGPLLLVPVITESVRNLLSNFAAVSKDLPEQLKNSQAAFSSLSFGSLVPLAIVSGISGVLSLLFQTALIHYLAKALGGVGTWRYLIQVLLGFYNKWFPILFFLLYITTAVMFVSAFSPVVLCFVLILVGLTLYVSGKTSSKVGEAYDFGAGKGCVTVIISVLVIGLINLVIGYLMVQAMGLAFSQLIG